MSLIYTNQNRHSRSWKGNIVQLLVLALIGMFMVFPMIYIVNNAFKPLNELFIYPPPFFVKQPTFDNFRNLFSLMSQSWVPFTRYIFNTVFITAVGTFGHLFIASMAAFALAKHEFAGRQLMFNVVVLALMFIPAVTSIPSYIVMSKIGFIDTYLASLLPAFQSSLGLYLMKQFMETIPDTVLESARMDGAGEICVYWKIAMPMVKPAWLTLIILTIQGLWNLSSPFVYSEPLKTLPQAMHQILAGGIVRTGVGSAVALLMLIVPLFCFIFSQSQVIETMSTSGMKD